MVEAACRHLAHSAADGDRISVAKLDEHQVLGYDVAHAASAIAGCRVMLEYAERGEYESMLARGFVADALADLLARVLGRESTWGVEAGDLAKSASLRRVFESADVIIRQGDPPTDFYVIEQGEVEVARTTPAHPDGEVVTVLGPGSFFGEKALLNSEPRSATVRARTDVEVLVLGRNVFTQLSAALAPLRNALARTLNRRLLDPWQNQPGARERLARTLVRDLLEPAPQPLLKPTTTFAEALAAFAGATSDFLFISADGATLDGIVTLTDLGQEQTRQTPRTTPLSKFMSDKPLAIALDDTAVTAANTLREYRLTTLPVVDSRSTRRLAGVISTRRLTAIVLRDVEVV